jgi:tetratricopeptide (TPR) repeat protein|tara:strand:- start:103 stop:615 length:513 start_codon:yes stop_codon:yes gene_type:complete
MLVPFIGTAQTTSLDYSKLGVEKYNNKDYFGAIADFTKVIELNPKSGNAYKNRGLAKEKIFALGSACNDWKTAFKLGNIDAGEIFKEKYYCGDIRAQTTKANSVRAIEQNTRLRISSANEASKYNKKVIKLTYKGAERKRVLLNEKFSHLQFILRIRKEASAQILYYVEN